MVSKSNKVEPAPSLPEIVDEEFDAEGGSLDLDEFQGELDGLSLDE